MKKIITVLLLSIGLSASAQNTIAKIKYEQAEEAYANGNYKLALQKVNETEEMLKASNPKTLYLKIMAQHKLLDVDYAVITGLKKNIDIYIANYESVPELEDKFREVYMVYEDVKDKDDSQEFINNKLANEKAALEEEEEKKKVVNALTAFSDTQLSEFGFTILLGTDGKVAIRQFSDEERGKVDTHRQQFKAVEQAIYDNVPKEFIIMDSDQYGSRTIHIAIPKSEKYPEHHYVYEFYNYKKNSYFIVTLSGPKQKQEQSPLQLLLRQ